MSRALGISPGNTQIAFVYHIRHVSIAQDPRTPRDTRPWDCTRAVPMGWEPQPDHGPTRSLKGRPTAAREDAP